MKIIQTKDDKNRPVIKRELDRDIKFHGLGVYANEKYLSLQAKTEVIKRIAVRRDDRITEKDFGIQVYGIDYNITRIFFNDTKREMELSLSYVQ